MKAEPRKEILPMQQAKAIRKVAPAAPPVSPTAGPPWIGPVVPLHRYDRLWLGVYVAMALAATCFFGWRAAFMICLAAAVSLLTYLLLGLALHLVRGGTSRGSISQALNMGLLTGATLPLMPNGALAIVAGVLVGALVHVMGPSHQLRIHPVAAAYLLLMVFLPLIGQQSIGAVLSPSHVVFGDVWRFTGHIGGPDWMRMTVPDQFDAIRVPDPQRVMIDQQRPILRHSSRLVVLLRNGDLPRMEDVLIGAVSGPVGATSQVLLILIGLWLMYRRVGRWGAALIAIAAALITLLVLPVMQESYMVMSWQCFDDIGWKVTVAYLGYQLLASPLLLIVLVMMPLTAPRTQRGRLWYAIIIGSGVVLVRWFVPMDPIVYLPLVIGGAMCPLLDRLHHSPFIAPIT